MLTISDLTYRLGDRLLFDKAGVALPTRGARWLRRPQRRRQVHPVPPDPRGIPARVRYYFGARAVAGSAGSPRKRPAAPTKLIDFVLAADLERAALLERAETAGRSA